MNGQDFSAPSSSRRDVDGSIDDYYGLFAPQPIPAPRESAVDAEPAAGRADDDRPTSINGFPVIDGDHPREPADTAVTDIANAERTHVLRPVRPARSLAGAAAGIDRPRSLDDPDDRPTDPLRHTAFGAGAEHDDPDDAPGRGADGDTPGAHRADGRRRGPVVDVGQLAALAHLTAGRGGQHRAPEPPARPVPAPEQPRRGRHRRIGDDEVPTTAIPQLTVAALRMAVPRPRHPGESGGLVPRQAGPPILDRDRWL